MERRGARRGSGRDALEVRKFGIKFDRLDALQVELLVDDGRSDGVRRELEAEEERRRGLGRHRRPGSSSSDPGVEGGRAV